MTNLIRAEYGGGKLSVPVDGPLAYVRFKHVRGVPAHDDHGYSVYRLKVLDSMIEGLHSGGVPSASAQQNAPTAQSAAQDLKSVVQSLQGNPGLSRAVTHAPVTGEATGLLLNLMA